MGEGIGKVIMFLIFTAIIGSVLSVIFGMILIFNTTETIESKTKIQPDFRLEANGKRVDTVWVYKFKSE
jgi:hypothetical protein